MNKNEEFVITINREVGSGGHTVAQKLADRLGVVLYDKVIIETLIEKYGLSVEEIEHLKGRKKYWWSDFKFAMGIGSGFDKLSGGSSDGYVRNIDISDDMFLTEMKMLREIADNESCVITGRCAFFILHNHPNHLSVLIQASRDARVERVIRKQGLTQGEALKVIEKVDEMRENYVKRYTDTSRYDTRNYDIVLNSDGKTEDELVDIIMQYIN